MFIFYFRKCKSWGGSFTDIQEFEDIIQFVVYEDGKLKSILQNEIALRKHTSHDAKTRPQLYKLNQISIPQMKANLTMILNTECDMTSKTIPDMPTEDDMVRILLNSTMPDQEDTSLNSQQVPSQQIEVAVNEPCVVIWDTSSNRQWYVRICI